jgi:hypothetical protein
VNSGLVTYITDSPPTLAHNWGSARPDNNPPTDTGMAFVLVQIFDPGWESALSRHPVQGLLRLIECSKLVCLVWTD